MFPKGGHRRRPDPRSAGSAPGPSVWASGRPLSCAGRLRRCCPLLQKRSSPAVFRPDGSSAAPFPCGDTASVPIRPANFCHGPALSPLSSVSFNIGDCIWSVRKDFSSGVSAIFLSLYSRFSQNLTYFLQGHARGRPVCAVGPCALLCPGSLLTGARRAIWAPGPGGTRESTGVKSKHMRPEICRRPRRRPGAPQDK